MSQRINISVPDDLYETLQKHKDAINVSKICQEALSAEVRKKEDFYRWIHEEPDIKEVASRLKAEMFERYSPIVEAAREDGIGWAKAAPYKEINEALSFEYGYDVLTITSVYDFIDTKYGITTGPDEYALLEYFEMRLSGEKIDKSDYNEIEEIYGIALRETVREFYWEIKKHWR